MTPTPATLALFLLASSSNSFTPTFPGGMIAWLICYGRRRKEIGGFLMFFYWSLFSGIVVTLVVLAINLESYVPESFANPRQYHLFLWSGLPLLLVYVLQALTGILLLFVRTWDMLKLLRVLLVAELVCALLGLAIDLGHFRDNLFFDGYSIVVNAIWVGYFYRSKRVQHVFKLKDWPSAVDRMYPSDKLGSTAKA